MASTSSSSSSPTIYKELKDLTKYKEKNRK